MRHTGVRLGDVARVISGYAFKSRDFVEEGIPVLKIANIKHEHVVFDGAQYVPQDFLDINDKFKVKFGDIMICLTGSHISQPNSMVGRVAMYRHERLALLNQRAGRIIVEEKQRLDKDFLYYFLRQEIIMRDLARNAGGAANQANISPKDVERIELPHIKLSSQKGIAAILKSYDDLIENNKRRIALLEESARQLYKEWFVRFRFPGHERVKFVDGVPDGWERKKLKDLVTLSYGKALKADSRVPGDIPVFGSSGVVGTHNQALVKGPGIIIGRKGNVGAIYWSDTDFYPIDTVYYINAEQSSYFLFYSLLNLTFINTDVAVPGLNRNLAYSREVLLPLDSLRRSFEEHVDSIFRQRCVLEKFNNQLVKARDLLLPKLMSGELAV